MPERLANILSCWNSTVLRVETSGVFVKTVSSFSIVEPKNQTTIVVRFQGRTEVYLVFLNTMILALSPKRMPMPMGMINPKLEGMPMPMGMINPKPEVLNPKPDILSCGCLGGAGRPLRFGRLKAKLLG